MKDNGRVNEGVKGEEESPTRRRANTGVKRNIKPRAQALRPANSGVRNSGSTELQPSDIENKDPKKQAKKRGAKGKNTKAALTSGSLAKKASKRKAEEDDDTEEEEEPPRKRTKRQESGAATALKSGTGGVGKGREGKGKGKRKATDDELEQEGEPSRKKLRKEGGGPLGGRRGGKKGLSEGRGKRKPLGVLWEKKVLTTAPEDILDVYVFGANRRGELGFQRKDIRGPYWNVNLSGQKAGIVQIATGSYHSVALTHDNRILSWGYNFGGALGREVPRDPNDDQGDDAEPNDWEYTPMEIPEGYFPIPGEGRRPDIAGGLVFTQVVAGDMFSLALTDDGYVYGWGTFKVSIPPKLVSLANSTLDVRW
jgi:regulator of chromosome condensation